MQEILSNQDIEQKINRLAHQLLENCFEEKQIYIGGIIGNGAILANRLGEILKKHSDLDITVFEIKMNKQEPWADEIVLTADKQELKNGFIVLVDDVLNSGKTMQYALVEILGFPTKAIKTVALVDRKHRRFPIKANFVGLSLSTTLKERVEVDLTKDNQKAYLV
ncbi:MAG: phosphoribosyltransferase family protein [Crocinitomicaceae bacterium]|nr:phosphoribosyltransferase family protein [Crocinitomicaceae bacterium]